MKNKIVINKGNDKLNFYLVSPEGRFYLFTQKYTKGVYDFFKNGRSERELISYKRWNRNPKIDKTVEKIPMYIRYVQRDIAA